MMATIKGSGIYGGRAPEPVAGPGELARLCDEVMSRRVTDPVRDGNAVPEDRDPALQAAEHGTRLAAGGPGRAEPPGITGECKKCPEEVQGATAREAVDAAMKHADEAHNDKYLGFRWAERHPRSAEAEDREAGQ